MSPPPPKASEGSTHAQSYPRVTPGARGPIYSADLLTRLGDVGTPGVLVSCYLSLDLNLGWELCPGAS